jgi:hypothetical protein
MQKILFRSLILGLLLTSVSLSAQATYYYAGVFSKVGDFYNKPKPSPVGNFLDAYYFKVDSAEVLDILFYGSHRGMFADDLLLTNINTSEQYHLRTIFDQTFGLGEGSYIFTLSGFALNAIDPRISADYDLYILATPLPASIWLFGSVVLGFSFYSRRCRASLSN